MNPANNWRPEDFIDPSFQEDSEDDGQKDSAAYWGEPENALPSFDSDLATPLHETGGATALSDAEFSRRLRIDEFVASVPRISETQTVRATELLNILNPRRLKRWLPWLRQKQWTGQSLALFIDFRLNRWEKTQEWWEGSILDYRLGFRRRAPATPGILTLDKAYILVQARLHSGATVSSEVIKSSWFDEWDEFAAWERGFDTFADFAIWRARIGGRRIQDDDGETFDDVLPPIDWEGAFTQDEIRRLARAKPKNYFDVQDWFAIHQDWHKPSDWHDNLGF